MGGMRHVQARPTPVPQRQKCYDTSRDTTEFDTHDPSAGSRGTATKVPDVASTQSTRP